MSDAANPGSVWDPFRGELPFVRETAPEPRPGIRVPGWLKSALGLLCIASVPLLLAGIFWPEAALRWGVPMLVVSIGGLLAVDFLGREGEAKAWRQAELARMRGWAFRAVPRARRAKARGRAGRTSGSGLAVVRDPQIAPAYERIGILLAPRPGQPIGVEIEAQYWGATREGVPFWLGLQEMDADATLGAAAMRRDAHGGVGTRGAVFAMVAAYDLVRDTGIRARLFAEGPIASRSDETTESVEFNRLFAVEIERPMGAEAEGARLRLMQTLTPATQATLIDLHARYRAQVLIDGPTIYFSGYDRLMIEDPEARAAYFSTIVEAFADAATSFKRYAE